MTGRAGEAPPLPERTARKRLCKSDKLRLFTEFSRVKQHGGEAVGRLLLLKAAPSTDGALRCGVICGRKFSLSAVKRNRARRLLWESFRLLKPHVKAAHLVLIPRRRLLDCKRQAATKELAMLLARMDLLSSEIAASPPEG